MPDNSNSFLNNIDTTKLNTLMQTTTLSVQYFDTTCATVVKKYSESLDNLMSDIYVECIKNSSDAPTELLENYLLELSNMIYFMFEQQEKLGVYADMSKAASKEVFSKTYLNNQVKDASGKSKTTIAALQAQANVSSQYEQVVANVYDRAYQIVKNKVGAAQEMVNSIRKILNVRIKESEVKTYFKGKTDTEEN